LRRFGLVDQRFSLGQPLHQPVAGLRHSTAPR
jgi:hypothetical protein